MRFDVFLHHPPALERKLDQILNALDKFAQSQEIIMAQIDDLKAAASDVRTEVAALGIRVSNIQAQLAAAIAAGVAPDLTPVITDLQGIAAELKAAAAGP